MPQIPFAFEFVVWMAEWLCVFPNLHKFGCAYRNFCTFLLNLMAVMAIWPGHFKATINDITVYYVGVEWSWNGQMSTIQRLVY